MTHTLHTIPQIEFTCEQYNPHEKQIRIDLNQNLWLHKTMNEYEYSHLRLLPSVHVKSPSGKISYFNYPRMEGDELTYVNKQGVRVSFYFSRG